MNFRKMNMHFLVIPLFIVLLGTSNYTPTHEEVIKNSLFDIIVDIPNSYKTVEPGGELLANIKLINLGSAGRADVILNFWITDPSGEITISKTETVAVETQANFVRSFDIPVGAASGKYSLHAKITYADGKEATSEYSFDVSSNTIKIPPVYMVFIALIVIVPVVLYQARHMLIESFMKMRISSMVRKKQK